MLSRVIRPIVVGAGLLGVTAALAGCSGPAAENRSYTDGLYAAWGGYSSPGGPQGINVAVQLKNDEVAWVMVTPSSFIGEALHFHRLDLLADLFEAERRVTQAVFIGEAAQFQSRFAQEITGEVVGKDIDQITVSRIAGSSLTSTAFNDALSEIKTEAVEP